MNNKPIIICNNVSKSYKTKNGKVTPVLNNINLTINRGDFVSIMGPSGVGKSTLLYILGTLDNPDTGNITLNTNDNSYNFSSLNANQLSIIRNKHIGFVFQFHHLLPEFTALENIMMPCLIAGDSFAEAQKKANDLIKLIDVEIRSNHKPMELSGGEQQRIAIARALINRPDIVFADEPTGNLDSKNADAILALISRIKQEFNTTFVVATHSNDVANISKNKIVMRDGQICN